MLRDIPKELETTLNRQVLRYIEGLSAHSDVVEALGAALKPLGDVQCFCPDPAEYRYVVGSTRGVIFAVALGMNSIGFRLDERMKSRALASGGAPFLECGPEWVSFTVFRDDWPGIDLEFWARKAYATVRELER